MEKFKKVLNSNYFFIIIVLIISFLLLNFTFRIGKLNKFFNWRGWEGISSIVLAITFIFIAIESIATKKSANYLEHSIKPIAWFIIRSAKTLIEREYVEKDTGCFIRRRRLFTGLEIS